jgi:hypothetical protein
MSTVFIVVFISTPSEVHLLVDRHVRERRVLLGNQPFNAWSPIARKAQPIFAAFAQPAAVTTESDVAEAVWLAANDASGQLRFPAGPDAVALAQSKYTTLMIK